ncbi:hypothetical protein EP7_005414 [Isosphaeraceae bacterium EP7]
MTRDVEQEPAPEQGDAVISPPRRGQGQVVEFEQAVYGNFGFWDKGYALLGHSPGCRPEWLADFKGACQRFGEATGGPLPADALFALRLPSGTWAVVGVTPQGDDDRGRPGALAFHGLFLAASEYRKVGFDPFALAGALRCDWGVQHAALPRGRVIAEAGDATTADADALWVARWLAWGRRVVLESSTPIEPLARRAWASLPARTRKRKSLATLAFSNAGRFDLLAVPKLAGVTLDPSYLVMEPGQVGLRLEPPPRPWSSRRRVGLAAGLVALAFVGVALAWLAAAPRTVPEAPEPIPVPVMPRVDVRPAPPTAAPAPDDDRRAAEALDSLAGRLGVDTGPGLDTRVARLADRLDYRGPLLDDEELAALAAEPTDSESARRERDLALAWHAHLLRFRHDEPWATGDGRESATQQAERLARWAGAAPGEPETSGETVPRTAAERAVDAVARHIASPVAVHPSPLSPRYPALRDYVRFLSRLPRR